MNIKDIYINPNNPRRIRDERYQKLKKSLQEFPKMMKLRPIIVDDKGMILGGNMRYLAMIDLGYREIPEGWVVKASELTEEERERFKIVDNIPFGDWDYDKLANEWDLEELQEWGIELPELEGIIEPNEKDDEVPEPPKEPKSKLGELYQLGDHRLYCGDNRRRENVEKLMNGNKGDMVFTDPPYNSLTTWGKQRGKKESRLNPERWFDNDGLSIEEYLKLLTKSFDILRLILNDNSPFYICTDFRVYDLNKRALEECGGSVKHCIVWNKNQWGLGWKYRFKHEFLIYGSFSNDCNFYGGRDQPDVWDIDVDREGLHSTQKPVALVVRAIKHSTKENELTVDLFGGSGTTLIACEKLNRRCYMMEIDPIYIDIIIERWENYTNKVAVKIND